MADRADACRSLLFGLLALRKNLIDADALVFALEAWIPNTSGSIGEVLVKQGALDAGSRALVEGLATEQLGRQDLENQDEPEAPVTCAETNHRLEQTRDHVMSDTASHRGTDPRMAPDQWNQRVANSAAGSSPADERFQVIRNHAQGGLSTVYVAVDLELDREVALKQIRDNRADDPTSRARFLLEAKITGALEHPGIVPVYALGVYADGRPYYAMRLIKG